MSGGTGHAYLFYGICWDDADHVWPWQESWLDADDWNGDMPDELTPETWLQTNLPELVGVIEIDVHCTDESPMGFVSVCETARGATRGNPEKLLNPSLSRDLDTRNTWVPLKRFCEKAGYDMEKLYGEGRIGWWLVAHSSSL